MVCEIVHFGNNGAAVCILIHRKLSAPISKVITQKVIISSLLL